MASSLRLAAPSLPVDRPPSSSPSSSSASCNIAPCSPWASSACCSPSPARFLHILAGFSILRGALPWVGSKSFSLVPGILHQRLICHASSYCLEWVFVLPLEIIAAAYTISYWSENTSKSIFVAIFLVIIIVINLFGVKAYGEAEFIFSIIKVTAVVGFMYVSSLQLFFIPRSPSLSPFLSLNKN